MHFKLQDIAILINSFFKVNILNKIIILFNGNNMTGRVAPHWYTFGLMVFFGCATNPNA